MAHSLQKQRGLLTQNRRTRYSAGRCTVFNVFFYINHQIIKPMNSSILSWLKSLTLFLCVLSLFWVQNINAQASEEIPAKLNDLGEKLRISTSTEDAELRASLFKEDGVHVTGWGDAVKGREAIRKHYEHTFSKSDSISTEFEAREVTDAGKFVTLRGIVTLSGLRADGEPFSEKRYYAILVENIKDTWKIVWDFTGPKVNSSEL